MEVYQIDETVHIHEYVYCLCIFISHEAICLTLIHRGFIAQPLLL